MYIADTGAIGLERIASAAACRGNCNATPMFGTLGISNSLSSDRARYMYMENGTRVLRYDATTTNTVVIYSSNGIQGGQTFGYGSICGVSFDRRLAMFLSVAIPRLPARPRTIGFAVFSCCSGDN